MSEAVERFLLDAGTAGVPHSGRTLYAHLAGTERILRQWRVSETVCLAGRFHSIYGTNAFRRASIQVRDRAALQALIGAAAEDLVYLFHHGERSGCWLDALRTGGIFSRIDGQFLALDEPSVGGLIAVECANLIEQGGGTGFLSRLAWAMDEYPIELEPGFADFLASVPGFR
ncbi:hypothetical protein GTP91_03240 [Rugamonas sp. FT82W]|uniref:DUF6817 domain-containing protein n=1 Tax=Duganella vulcania TaxID=2692166 RepID=A0A845FXB3_9BURK|nr:hypothetical protein [Duganella vulcania]MYM86191.1 hypothetical protein [Duganella vulcania]